ncbi:MAG TPA: hypothetical protein VKR06_35485 [Ktedonosporobacter sp.]|nr:hypothetical protein [Ktedonosporobacter sp.]
MTVQVLSQEDFFLYVPAMQNLEHSRLATRVEPVDLPLGNAAWVKISLSGEVVVYAHILDDDDQTAYN